MNMIALNEVYFKRGDKMDNLVNQLDIIKKKVEKTKDTDYNEVKKLSTCPEVRKFNRDIASFFGFKTFALHIEEYSFINAWTIPISSKYDINAKDGKKYIKRTPEGYKFVNNEYNLLMIMTTALLRDRTYSAEDIMAVILHEIGHNFSFVIDNMGGVFGVLCKMCNLYGLLLGYIEAWWVDYDVAKQLAKDYYNDDNNGIRKLADHLHKKDNLLINISSIFITPLSFMSTIGIIVAFSYISPLLKFNPVTLMHQLYGYNDEKVADNFAAMYGFSENISKFNQEIYTMRLKDWDESSAIIKIVNIIAAPFVFISTIGDPHPYEVVRIMDQIKYLEKELDKEDMDEDMKAQIKIDINKTKKELNKLYDTMKKYKGEPYCKIDGLLVKLFGKSVRELILRNKDYNANYDNVPE